MAKIYTLPRIVHPDFSVPGNKPVGAVKIKPEFKNLAALVMDGIDLANPADKFTTSGTQTRAHISSNKYSGMADKYGDTAAAYIHRTQVEPPNSPGWTLFLLVTPHAAAYSTSAGFWGYTESPGNSTYDRQIRLNSSDQWEGYIYDTGTKVISSGVTYGQNRTDAIVVTCTPSTLAIVVNQAALASRGVTKSGFTGYSTPEICLGNLNNIAIGDYSVHLAGLDYRVWSEVESREWIADPFRYIFEPAIPIQYFVPDAAPPAPSGLTAGSLMSMGVGI